MVFSLALVEEQSRPQKTDFNRSFATDFLAVALTGFMLYLALYYIGKDISGCHLNPAVSLAMVFMKKTKIAEGVVFAICQLVAGFLAALLFMAFQTSAEDDMAPDSSITTGYFQALLLESQLSMIFIFIFINSVMSKNVQPRLQGFLVACGFFLVTGASYKLTGGGVNPAKSLPLNFVRGFFDSTHIFLFAPFIGSVLAIVKFFSQIIYHSTEIFDLRVRRF